MKSLYISNFKNFKELTIPSLGRINLITGKNNTGKTSLLEAIAILASNGNFESLLDLLTRRGELSTARSVDNHLESDLETLSSLFWERTISYKKDFFIEIGEKIDKNSLKLSLAKYRVVREVINEGDSSETTIKRIRVEDDLLEEETSLIFEVKKGNSTRGLTLGGARRSSLRSLNLRYNEPFGNKIQLVFSSDIDDTVNAQLWDKIVLTEKEEYVVEALRIIEPRIDRITFVSLENSRRERRAVLKLKGKTGVYTLKSMGDGINRILSIVLALVNCAGGTLLVDELENGLHFAAQEKLWEIIFKLSKKLNIQVFATTHSNDCIFSYAKVLQGTNGSQLSGKLLRLDRVEDKIEAITYSEDELEIILDQNIETRL